MAKQATAVLGARSAMLVQVAPDHQTLELIGSAGYRDGALDDWKRFSLSAPVPLAEAIRLRAPIWPESREERTIRYPHLTKAYAERPSGSWLSVPLIAHGQSIGGLSLNLPENPEVDALDRQRYDYG